jgi:putative lipoprotein (rSAM/lipoprotein system)
MKKAVLKTYGKLVGVLLSFVGFLTGCSLDNHDEGGIIAMYGVPGADFVISGNVKDAQSGTPVKNIRVVVPANATYGDTVYTNANGDYEVTLLRSPTLDQTFDVIASDVDGSVNGGPYRSDTLKVQFTKNDKVANGSGWNTGTYKKAGQNFSLKNNGPIAMYGVMGASYKADDEH